MGKEIRGVSEDPALDAQRSEGWTARPEPIGAYLARQRRLRDISLEQLAETTRIPLRSLERLEAGAFDDDPDGFVRGFVRTVAAGLGLDAEDAVSRMLPEVRPGRLRGGGRRGSRRIVLGFVGLTLALGGLWAFARIVSGPDVAEGQPSRVVFRQDAVRLLAEQQRAVPPEPPAPRPDALDR